MKKIVLIIAVMSISVISFAQTKGEMFIAGTVSADLGTQKTTLSDGSYSTSAKQPLSSSFGLALSMDILLLTTGGLLSLWLFLFHHLQLKRWMENG